MSIAISRRSIKISLGELEGTILFWPDFLGNLVLGVFGELLGGWLIVYKLNSGYRQRSFLSGILISGVAFLVIFLLLGVVLIFLMAFIFFAFKEGIAPAFDRAYSNAVYNLSTPSLFVAMFAWALMVLGTQFMLQVNDKFGQGVLWKFLTGKYYYPRVEERIFMFLDLKSSTMIAERIGSTMFFGFMKDVFRDITEPIVHSHDEIYQYVCDEVVITWPVDRGLRDDNCIKRFFHINEALTKHKTYY